LCVNLKPLGGRVVDGCDGLRSTHKPEIGLLLLGEKMGLLRGPSR